LPDAPHRAARRACPEAQFAAMKPVNIKILWYKAGEAAALGHLLNHVKTIVSDSTCLRKPASNIRNSG